MFIWHGLPLRRDKVGSLLPSSLCLHEVLCITFGITCNPCSASGNHEEALNILKNLEAYVPGLALVAMRRIGMERRKGNFADLETMYNKYIEEADDNQVKSFFAIKYARFLAKVRLPFLYYLACVLHQPCFMN